MSDGFASSVLKGLPTILLFLILAAPARAETFLLPPADVEVVGQIRVVYSRYEETLLDVARRYSLGYEEIGHANPGVDRWLPGEDTPIVLPTRYVLPDAPRQGIVLNLPEMRLYYYPPPKKGEKPVVVTHPVSIGRMDWRTPLGKTTVVAKQTDPPWYPPASIKAEHAAKGDILPDVVPGGPDNPLGRFAMRLGLPGYLIHGTDKPYGIGMRVTHGCLRMYPEDIEKLFPNVPVGTPVHIVNQPMKAGWYAGTLFMEFHPPLEEHARPLEELVTEAIEVVGAKAAPYQPDPVAIRLVVEQASGLPVPVSY